MNKLIFLGLILLSLAAGSCSISQAPLDAPPIGETDTEPVTLENGMLLIPAGEVTLIEKDPISNTERPENLYVDDFYMDAYEITNGQYARCVSEASCVPPENNPRFTDPANAEQPIINVTLDMARSYCQWQGGRLPTKDEWEKAAYDELAEVDYYWGDRSPICESGARLPLSADEVTITAAPPELTLAGEPNIYGLYQMTGGVWEWVDDAADGPVAVDPSAGAVAYLRMARWTGYGPIYQSFYCGFRCVQTP